MNKIPYHYAPLRYVHDTVTSEFLNIGIVLFSAKAKYFRARITPSYSRLSNAFLSIDHEHYRRIVRYIESAVQRVEARWKEESLIPDEPLGIQEIMARVLPPDDSSIQCGSPGGGIASDLESAMEILFERYVGRYLSTPERSSRNDEEVWSSYRPALEKYKVIQGLRPVNIIASDYEYEFRYAWKNDRWHPIEPVSFDLVKPSDILDKANRWLGRATCLKESDQIGKLYLLLGNPRTEEGQDAFKKAKHILGRIPLENEMITEDRKEQFAARMIDEMKKHR